MSTFTAQSTADHVAAGLDLTGRTYLVTGATSGIGKETARVLAAHGSFIVGTGRSAAQAQAALDEVAPGKGKGVACELSEPASVRAAVDIIGASGRRFDGFIANAGIMALPKLETKHGLELQFLTNHVGHFILVMGLAERLTDNGRVVMVSSMAHMNAPPAGIDFDNLDGSKSYSPFRAYGTSKLANILFANELAQRFAGSSRTANSLHPGVIRTNLTRHMPDLGEGIFARLGESGMKSIPQGAATQVLLAVHPSAAGVSGTYWSDCAQAEPSAPARDGALARRLWQVTADLVAKL